MTVKNKTQCRFKGVLFDLDGTLIDTAPDLADALNELLTAQGRAALPFETIRPVVSHGSPGLLKLGFGLTAKDADFEHLKERLLTIYQRKLSHKSRLFPGGEALLNRLEQDGVRWGIVTNKPAFLTEPLLNDLQLFERASTVISGDSLAQKKPHPAPLYAACEQMQLQPADCVYVGDAERDIAAGRNAGMETVIAGYGYFDAKEPLDEWLSHHYVESLTELCAWLYYEQ